MYRNAITVHHEGSTTDVWGKVREGTNPVVDKDKIVGWAKSEDTATIKRLLMFKEYAEQKIEVSCDDFIAINVPAFVAP